MGKPAPVIFGCAGHTLTQAEVALFARVRPWGLILFGRNCDSKEQVRALTAQFRKVVGDPEAPILIDQEGGRVARLNPPVWDTYPAPGRFAELCLSDAAAACEAVFLNAQLMARELQEIGVTVNCAPMVDVRAVDANEVIGDRAYGDNANDVALLGRAVSEGLLAGGVLPILKHIPGHGRARSDSHKALPTVFATRAELARDFQTFEALSALPMAMTAHVVFTAVDPENAATVSSTVIAEIIRGQIGFGGLLMTDDISSNMKALPGDFAERARHSLAAGCDVVLHCDGDLAGMESVAAVLPELSPITAVRIKAALACRIKPVDIVVAEAVARRDMLLSVL